MTERAEHTAGRVRMGIIFASSTTTVVDGLPVQALPTSWPVVDSRSVAAEWRDGLLDAGGDTKRLSRLEADGQYSQSAAPNLSSPAPHVKHD